MRKISKKTFGFSWFFSLKTKTLNLPRGNKGFLVIYGNFVLLSFVFFVKTFSLCLLSLFVHSLFKPTIVEVWGEERPTFWESCKLKNRFFFLQVKSSKVFHEFNNFFYKNGFYGSFLKLIILGFFFLLISLKTFFENVFLNCI